MRKNRPSKTAITVAKLIARIGADPESRHLVAPQALSFVRHALRQNGHSLFLRGIRSPIVRKLLLSCENWTIPGLALHQALRKDRIRRRVEHLLEVGATEVIQIGAGLDPLCYSLHKDWPDVDFTELDHPQTQRIKQRALSGAQTLTSNYTLEPLDLSAIATEPPPCAERNPPRVLILEGVMMYLPSDQIAALLRYLRQRFGAASTLIFTFFTGPGFSNQSVLVDPWLRLQGEPFLWWAELNTVTRLLNQSGWGSPTFHATWHGPDSDPKARRVANGEWIAETKAADFPLDRNGTPS